ncbi:MAG: histidine kinase [Clostridiales bacterium]|nr:histidine kinase [Clostridiales bacterium]
MTERLRGSFFLVTRILLLLVLEIYIVFSQSILTGASYRVLLLLALFVGTMSGKELTEKRLRWIFIGAALFVWLLMIQTLGREFLILGILLYYEIITLLRPKITWYGIPLVMACVPSGIGVAVQMMFTLFLGLLYIQNDFVVSSYREQTKEDIMSEQRLKRDLYEKEHEYREEMNRGLLKAENQLLEERARLSQTLHDKLGHSINGSVYQLEAVKLLMEKEPEKSRKMLQAVIDQLRTGMDEIRMILRKERPEKYKLALLQLTELCDACNEKGIEAVLLTEGKMAEVPEKYLEIILDNACEAVSNSLKYAGCTKIEIKIHVMNQVIRCSISDNGVGCKEIVDGMGIAGMRRRVREVKGILDFDTELGFTINMLLPR